MVRDPVCGMEVDPSTAAAEVEYDGQSYYFCSEECKQDFESDPERYAQSATQSGGERY